ncbi:MAG: nitroreductase family protein [Desulfobacteraceae bacterium]
MFMKLLEKRRSIRQFTSQAIEPEKIETLVEAALRSPSGRGINPWEFILVEDRETLACLSKAKQHGAAFLKGAALGMVVCANGEKSDTIIEDASIAATIIHLAAADLGLGSCWVQMRNRAHPDGRPAQEHIASLLGLPSHYMVQCVIAIGYPAETKAAHAKERLDFDKVHRGRFGKKMYS